jgi:hypothetical protein
MAYKDKDQQRAFQLNWITARRRKYIEAMGACFFCGKSWDIQIHHRDPKKKFTHRIWSYAEDRIELELKQCIALCKHCHDKFHALEKHRHIEHGTTTAYRYGCRCNECKNAKHKAYRIKKASES